MSAPLLQVDQLSVRFGAATVVNEVSFNIEPPARSLRWWVKAGSGKSSPR
jgi:ABC-type branched-subunit amino acid transport system ATPase component